MNITHDFDSKDSENEVPTISESSEELELLEKREKLQSELVSVNRQIFQLRKVEFLKKFSKKV